MPSATRVTFVIDRDHDSVANDDSLFDTLMRLGADDIEFDAVEIPETPQGGPKKPKL